MGEPELKTGLTTGTCAAAASRGAAALLFGGIRLSHISVMLPGGREVTLAPHRLTKTRRGSFCSVVKDAGDDPDITDGAVICASVARLKEPLIRIEGGSGVGKVTRRGLQIPVGEVAINPTPRRMIEEAVRSVLPLKEGARVVISVKNGAALARKTFNPRLGIVDGISILGTTGIVQPKSVDAFKTSLLCSLDIAQAEHHRTVILVPGQIGERGIRKYLKKREIPIIQMSNFVGFMLKKCREKGVERIILAGHPGKLVKLIRGDFDTHSSRSASAVSLVMEEIAPHAPQPNTVEEIIQTLAKADSDKVFSRLSVKISQVAEQYAGLRVGVVLLSMNGDMLGSCIPFSRRGEMFCSG